MDFISPGSQAQAKEGSFFGLEAALEGLEPGTPTETHASSKTAEVWISGT
ncbi:putative photosystem I chlorophyll a/b-binding protein 5, chloroplastic [Sesbania bispinosa]|nr:putative photosystem I chlorophyll a/b-binding protein 5, chloroplastic [Sesbania bispinosa]